MRAPHPIKYKILKYTPDIEGLVLSILLSGAIFPFIPAIILPMLAIIFSLWLIMAIIALFAKLDIEEYSKYVNQKQHEEYLKDPSQYDWSFQKLGDLYPTHIKK